MPSRAEGNLFVNALIGAVVSVVVFFVPFSPVLGGAVAAYLEGGDQEHAIKTGAVSGVLAAIPLVLVIFAVALLVPFFGFLVGEAAVGIVFIGVLIVVSLAFSALYTVGLSALGGVVGIELRDRD